MSGFLRALVAPCGRGVKGSARDPVGDLGWLRKVRATVVFYEDKETDQRLNSSAASRTAIRQAVAAPTYKRMLAVRDSSLSCERP
jgi:hypothetical protein